MITNDIGLPTTTASPEENANIFSRILFSWAQPLFTRAAQLHKENKALSIDDLCALPSKDFGSILSPKFEDAWKEQAEKLDQRNNEGNKKKPKTNSTITKSLSAVTGRPFIYAGLIKAVNTAIQFLFPILLNEILKFIEGAQAGGDFLDEVDDPWHVKYRGYWLSALLFLAMALKAITENFYFNSVYRAGYQTRVAICVAVYNKALRLASSERHGTTLGELVNLMQVDASKIEMFVPQIHVVS